MAKRSIAKAPVVVATAVTPDGQKIEMTAGEIADMKAMYTAAFGTETSLTDQQIAEVVATSDDDLDDAAWAEAMQQAELGDETEVIEDDDRRSSAIELGTKLDDTTFKHLDTALAAKGEVKRGLAYVWLDLERLFPEFHTDFPIVGSKEGNNPDIYRRRITKSDGTTGEVNGSWYNDFTDTHARVRAIADELEKLEAKKNSYPGGIVAWNKARARLTEKRNHYRSTIRRAAMLGQQLKRVNDMGTVEASLIFDDEANTVPTTTSKQVWLVNTQKRSEFLLPSIGSFLGYNVTKAIAAGGKYADLTATANRKPRQQNVAATAAPSISGPVGHDVQVTNVANYYDGIKLGSPEYKALVKHLSNEGADDTLASLDDIAIMISQLMKDVPHARTRIKAVRDRDDTPKAEEPAKAVA